MVAPSFCQPANGKRTDRLYRWKPQSLGPTSTPMFTPYSLHLFISVIITNNNKTKNTYQITLITRTPTGNNNNNNTTNVEPFFGMGARNAPQLSPKTNPIRPHRVRTEMTRSNQLDFFPTCSTQFFLNQYQKNVKNIYCN